MTRALDRRVLLVAVALVAALLVVVAGVKATADRGPLTAATTTAAPQATLAFAGDVHFEGSSASALDNGLGSAAAVLAKADLSFVNLETAVTTRGTPEPKTYTFRAPPRAFTALKKAGVDAVSMANNHGMDYGRVGLKDSIAAAKARRYVVLGANLNDTGAFSPVRRTVNGIKVSVFAATDVLDSFALNTWTATPTRAGLASIKSTAGLNRLLKAVTAEKTSKRADVVAVILHWGVETRVCPTVRQRDLAKRFSAAGADVLVGSHAHVLQPNTTVGKTAVHYGMGNFVFYARSGKAIETGVYTVTVTKKGVKGTAWAPATIRSGRPALLTGTARTAAITAQKNRGAGC